MPAKSLPWRQDPVILERMERVADLDIRRWSIRRIAQAVNVSPATVLKDQGRIRQLRRDRLTDGDVEDQRQEAIAVYRREQAEAWERLEQLPPEARNAPEYLNAINAAQKEIDRLEGTAKPTRAEIGGIDGVPISITLKIDRPAYEQDGSPPLYLYPPLDVSKAI